jgi:hypothetical protein
VEFAARVTLGFGFSVVKTLKARLDPLFPIGERVDADAFDKKTRLLYLSAVEGKVFVSQQDSPGQHCVAQEIITKPGAKL